MLKKVTILILLTVCLSGMALGCGIKKAPTPPEEPAQKK